jgi:methyl-accepting chemotaxis protein
MISASEAVVASAAAATQVHGTTRYVTDVMVPVAETASRNAATAAEAALETQQLALGIGEIDQTAHALRDQAAQLQSLVAKFIIAQPRKDGTRPSIEFVTA